MDGIRIATIRADGSMRYDVVHPQAAVLKCPFLIMVPEHFRSDGTCKCDCAVERARMVAEWEYTLEDFQRVGIEP